MPIARQVAFGNPDQVELEVVVRKGLFPHLALEHAEHFGLRQEGRIDDLLPAACKGRIG